MIFTGKLAKLGFAALMILCTQSAFSRNNKSTQYQPQRTDQIIRIDGIGDEEAWKSVKWGSDFVQTAPYSGEAPSQKTAFKILYDVSNVFPSFVGPKNYFKLVGVQNAYFLSFQFVRVAEGRHLARKAAKGRRLGPQNR